MKESIKKKIASYEIISFDIFDTMLLRDVPNPQDIFTVIEQKYKIKNFKKRRINAENLARKFSKQNEVTINDIYKYLDGVDKKNELDEEEQSLYANPDIIDIYHYAKIKNKKIICISDMYLEKFFIEKILKKNGFVEIDCLFISNEYQATKENGELYDAVLQQLNIKHPNKILHIGDNYYSDVKRAISKGFKALHYYPYNNIDVMSSCRYKEALMKNTIDSLYFANQLKNDLKYKMDKDKADYICQLKWKIHKIKNIILKCHLYGVSLCVHKILNKIDKKL